MVISIQKTRKDANECKQSKLHQTIVTKKNLYYLYILFEFQKCNENFFHVNFNNFYTDVSVSERNHTPIRCKLFIKIKVQEIVRSIKRRAEDHPNATSGSNEWIVVHVWSERHTYIESLNLKRNVFLVFGLFSKATRYNTIKTFKNWNEFVVCNKFCVFSFNT